MARDGGDRSCFRPHTEAQRRLELVGSPRKDRCQPERRSYQALGREKEEEEA